MVRIHPKASKIRSRAVLGEGPHRLASLGESTWRMEWQQGTMETAAYSNKYMTGDIFAAHRRKSMVVGDKKHTGGDVS